MTNNTTNNTKNNTADTATNNATINPANNSIGDHMTASNESTATKSNGTAFAVFAGGCFWCTEAVFEQLAGVVDVVSGYAGGSEETASYRVVCSGTTRHAEVIRIEYDPTRIGFEQLLDVFFDTHDPTTLNRQGNDIGPQYRSAIFVATESERALAAAKIAGLNAKGKFPRPIVTTIEPLDRFFPAEQYHQDYARRHPEEPYIQFQAWPKVCKVRDKHPGLVRTI
jgi:methionine-S-sulfoxide reductase